MAQQQKQAEMELQKYEIDTKAAADIETAKISAGLYDEPEDVKPEDVAKLSLEKEKLDETKRHNMATEEIDKMKARQPKTTSK